MPAPKRTPKSTSAAAAVSSTELERSTVPEFEALWRDAGGESGLVTSSAAAKVLVQTRLPSARLKAVWDRAKVGSAVPKAVMTKGELFRAIELAIEVGGTPLWGAAVEANAAGSSDRGSSDRYIEIATTTEESAM